MRRKIVNYEPTTSYGEEFNNLFFLNRLSLWTNLKNNCCRPRHDDWNRKPNRHERYAYFSLKPGSNIRIHDNSKNGLLMVKQNRSAQRLFPAFLWKFGRRFRAHTKKSAKSRQLYHIESSQNVAIDRGENIPPSESFFLLQHL